MNDVLKIKENECSNQKTSQANFHFPLFFNRTLTLSYLFVGPKLAWWDLPILTFFKASTVHSEAPYQSTWRAYHDTARKIISDPVRVLDSILRVRSECENYGHGKAFPSVSLLKGRSL